jgi:hypothetical protein
MTIFDFIKDILFAKSKLSFNNIDSEGVFTPYMLNRWASMYSNTLALYSNMLNKYYQFSAEKADIFNLFLHVFPRVKQKKIFYIKKTKPTEKTDENNSTALIANSLEISQREAMLYKSMLNTASGSVI